MAYYELASQAGHGTHPSVADHPTRLTSTPITLDPRAKLHPTEKVNPLLYSGFFEHLGRCIYGGVVDDPSNPSPADLLLRSVGPLGWRRDVMDIMGPRHLNVPMVRWPGGNFVSNYHWIDGVGPIADRKKRIELAWRTAESNLFGTDEFLAWCETAGIEPFICLNMGTGTLEEALAWVEYCNGTADTEYEGHYPYTTRTLTPH